MTSKEQEYNMDFDNFLTAYIHSAEELSADEFDGTDFIHWGDSALEEMKKDAELFFKDNYELMHQTGADPRQHGYDFWLTRNGHGCGFWDRGYGEVGEKLTEKSNKFAECHMYLGDDGKAYI